MRLIRGVALGTYYAAQADAARSTPNATAMRGLVYAVKDNREPPNKRQPIAHPLHPSPRLVWVDRDSAIEYVTAMLAQRIQALARAFGATDPREIALVPVPSSEVTAATIETARFRTLRLCRALAGVGLGTVAVLAVQRAAVVAKTKDRGPRRTADQILAGFVRTPIAVPRSAVIVLVDDNVQSGTSVAALDGSSAHRGRPRHSRSPSPTPGRARTPCGNAASPSRTTTPRRRSMRPAPWTRCGSRERTDGASPRGVRRGLIP